MKDTDRNPANPALYPWQRECISLWFERGCRGIVSAVTGSGKTMLAVRSAMMLRDMLADRSEKLSVRVAVPKTFLLSHWKAAFLRENAVSRPQIGLWCGSRKDAPSREVTLYVLNSARYALARHVLADIRAGRHVLLIVDECHHLVGEKNAKILEFLPKLGEHADRYHVLALSATADNIERDGRLVSVLGGVIYRYGLSRALRDGVVGDLILLPVAVYFLPEEYEEYDGLSVRLGKAVAEVKRLYPALRNAAGPEFFAALQSLAGEKNRAGGAALLAMRIMYARRKMMYMAENRILCACELVRRQPPDSRIILFGERISCARRIRAILEKDFPGQTAMYHSDMGAEVMRAELSRYRYGEARILITCRALDEGLDIPDTDIGIAVSSTRAERQRVQRLGRILRKSGSPLPARLYYIYLDESSEETIYLEQDFPFPIIPLSYGREARGFFNAEFGALAEAVLAQNRDGLLDKGRQTELCKQMALCLPRGDFCLTEDVCEAMRARAKAQSDRNYWTAALLLARARNCAR